MTDDELDEAYSARPAVRLPLVWPDAALHGMMRNTIIGPAGGDAAVPVAEYRASEVRVDVLCDLVSVVTFGTPWGEQSHAEQELAREAVSDHMRRLDAADPLRDRGALAAMLRRAFRDLGYDQWPHPDDVAAQVLTYARGMTRPFPAANAPKAFEHATRTPEPCPPGECELCDAFRPLNPRVDDHGVAPADHGTNHELADDRGLYVGLRRTGDEPVERAARCASCGLRHALRPDLTCPFCGNCALPGRKAPSLTTHVVVNGVDHTLTTDVRPEYARGQEA